MALALAKVDREKQVLTQVPVSIQQEVERRIDDLLALFPTPEKLSHDERRGIIARYAAVLEGNFIYWMTGAYIAAKSPQAREIIMENLHEEVRDSHPNMMRRFALAADAVPTESDLGAVYDGVSNVRQFIGRLSSVPIVVTMAFFEGFIQRFMPYLEQLAELQGSSECEYTKVHGVCDIVHTEELWRALASEVALAEAPASEQSLFEGVELLDSLIQDIKGA